MKRMSVMTNGELASLKDEASALIRQQESMMQRVPANTAAYKAMAESRPGLVAFWHAIDNELDRRGA